MNTSIGPSPRVHATPSAKQAIKDAGETHASAARAIGVHRTVLTEWLNGTRELRRDQVAVLAYVLKVDISELATEGIRCPSCNANIAGLVAA